MSLTVPQRRLLSVILALMSLPAALAQPSQAEPAPRPNILFILADDLGYGDLGCYGQNRILTPRLDRMAAEGVRFTQAYAGSAVCAPSRATLLLGQHTGHTFVRNNGGSYIRPAERTVADVLRTAGYRTAIFGKWGFGRTDGTGGPEHHGFDESLVYMTHRDAHDYTPDHLWKNGEKLPLEPGTYTPDLFTSAALEFVSRKHDSPWFLFLSYTIPHAHNAMGSETGNGMEIPDDAPFSDRDWPQPEKNKAAMITRMDTQVGMILDRLREVGLDHNTVVFFASDNGPHREGGVRPEFHDSNGPLRGIKRDLYEGGIRVPMIVRAPGMVKPGTVSDKIWAFWDFLPTAAELAGIRPPEGLDGLSMVEVLRGNRGPEHEYLYWELIDRSKLGSYQGFQQAVRMGPWKAIRRGNGTELYDMTRDPGEQHNVAAGHPDVVARAEKLFETARTIPENERTTGTAARSASRKRVAADNGTTEVAAGRPNVVLIVADDLGYADIGPFGCTRYTTPHLDRMASEGVRLTQFYVTSPACTPSRVSILTGRYPVRVGLPRVLHPQDTTGIPASEITLAEALKAQGYATAAIGKWHLGHLPEFLPTRHGFDEYFGLPYSNDMEGGKRNNPPLPLMRGTEVVEQPADQSTLTRRYTEESVGFIRRHADRPFFLYLAHTFPHVPLAVSERFRDRSGAGLYGDVVQELDWSVGEILKVLEEEGLDRKTLVIFTSDNGPWLIKKEHAGSAGHLRDGKATCYEGGIRVPFLAWWPGHLPAGLTVEEPVLSTDLLPTLVRLAGGRPPADRPLDGVDVFQVLEGTGKRRGDDMLFYRNMTVVAIRSGKWKLHRAKSDARGTTKPLELYDLEADPGETRNLAAEFPEIAQRLKEKAEAAQAASAPGSQDSSRDLRT